MSEARPKLMRDWVGRKVRNTHELNNRLGRYPIGREWLVTYNRSGLTLVMDGCECCGVQPSITGVPLHWVELLPEKKP